MYENIFCERLADLRIKKGVSARDMSLSIGQSAGYINGLENQKSYPSMQVFFYICEYLGVTPGEFFTTDNKYPREYRELYEELNKLEPDILEHILAIIKAMKK